MDSSIVFVCLGMASIVNGDLSIRGPNQSVLEGDSVTLECQYSDNEHNISSVRFESFSQILQMWHPVRSSFWSFCHSIMEQMDDKMVLRISHVTWYIEGRFRCVSDDHTLSAPNNVSKTLSLKIQYLAAIHLSRKGFSGFLGLPQELRVREGDDVALECSASCSEEPSYYWYKEGGDWILPSAVMTLRSVSAEDSGMYTCTAEHPTAPLNIMRNVTLVVLPEDASWFETQSGRVVLMTSFVAACIVVMLATALSVCLYCRKKRVQTKLINDKCQSKPIYKDSTEALHYNYGDKQPLVAV
ncbi:leucine-rich repeats and immunoglobulin-like domains protein 2 [Syngnathus acus]|uniref:leucine-rich repeats and immunoglobulin-like domains protein 2 n=1 Tax=Syngnathus acus TaxID=161584 RepID=UPI00188608CE|nr:leucine-rich repeats and immunoglobulin-like domains protein 2 [Syngnathus acus]